MTGLRPSAVILLLANLAPVAGVLWLDWQVFDILLLYWAENVVIGAINVLRMIVIRSDLGIQTVIKQRSGAKLSAIQRRRISKFASRGHYFLIPFFIVHYGMFCWGHYTAVVALFGQDSMEVGENLFNVALADFWQSPLSLGVAAIAISHLLSFYFNFLGRGEYQRTSLAQLMIRPYGRIIVLHIAVIAGGLLVTSLGDVTWMILVLVAAKSAVDLRMHERERVVFGEPKSVS